MVLFLLLIVFALTPLVMGTVFAFTLRFKLRRPALYGLLVVAEGYVLAAAIAVPIIGSAFSKVGLAGQPARDVPLSGTLEAAAIPAAVLLICCNLILLWLNRRILPKR